MIVKKHWLYFIYIILVIYYHFACLGNAESNRSHYVTLIIVLYLQSICIEIYFLYKIPTTRKWIIKLVGERYFIGDFSNGNKLLLKYYLSFPFYLRSTQYVLNILFRFRRERSLY